MHASFSIFITFFLLLFSSLIVRGQIVPGDDDYFKIDKPYATYIFTKDYVPFLEKLFLTHQKLDIFYRPSFQHQLDEKPVIVLASLKNQIPNAYATTLPYTLSMIYPSGAPIMEEITASRWITSVLAHEYAHLYQLNPKKELGKLAHDIFGNHPFLLLPIIPLPLFPSPNFITPRWLLEGNAVLNESIWGDGGRAHSGHYRAQFYSLVQSGVLNETRLTNEHLDFPFGGEKYIVGTYFMIYLAERFGIERVNSFFQEQANHYLIPLILNDTFNKHFTVNYSQLINNFLSYYKEKTKQAITQKETSILESVESTQFYKDQKFLYFLTTPDHKSPPILHKMDLKTKQIESEEKNLQWGKVFPINGHYYSASAGTNHFSDLHYSLWDENLKEIPLFHSHLLLDKKGNDFLSINMKDSIDQIHLYKNLKFFSVADSMAMMNEQKDIFYFRQDGDVRTLYKNRSPLFSFNGYYGKIVDIKSIVHPNKKEMDEIYYLANGHYGQNLFVYNSLTKKNQKVISSDFITNAVILNNDLIFIEEIGTGGYQYKIVKEEKRSEAAPYSYHYSFLKSAPESFNDETANVKKSELSAQEEMSPYNSLSHLKFSNWQLLYVLGGNLSTQANFVDPLNQNLLSSGFQMTSRENRANRDLYLLYQNQKNRLNFITELAYRPVEEENYKQYPSFTFGLLYPFFDLSRWTLKGNAVTSYNINSLHPFVHYASLDLSKIISYNHSFMPYRKFRLFPEFKKVYHGHKKGITGQLIYDLGNENLITSESQYTHSTTGTHKHGESLWKTKAWSTDFLFPTFRQKLRGSDIESYRLTLGYRKVLNSSYYFPVFPFSIRRFAPMIFASHVGYTQKNGLSRSHFDSPEYGYEIDSELLFAHLYPFHLFFNQVFRAKENHSQFNLGIYINMLY